jgi:hypothetical protein
VGSIPVDVSIADLIEAIEVARADGGGQLLVANVKARLHAARIFVGCSTTSGPFQFKESGF